MTEAEPARHLVGAQQVAGDELVEGGERVRLGHRRRRDREVELERVAGHGRRAGEVPHGRGEVRELGGDRGGHGAGHAGRRERRHRIVVVVGVRAAVGAAARELQQVERVAAAAPVQALALGRARVDQGRGVVGGQGAEPDLGDPAIDPRRSRSRATSAGSARAVRKPTAISTAASGGRRSTCLISSTDAPSLQCRSSSVSTNGWPAASRSVSARTARWAR